MGILDNIVSAFNETNENAHGARLKKDVFLTLELLHKAGPAIETESLMLYANLQKDVLRKCKSWSRDGQIKIANQLQAEARKDKDFDIGRSYGYYLASAFTESMVRDSMDAKLTFAHLGIIAIEIEKQIADQNKSATPKPDPVRMADLCMTGILMTAFWPSKGETSTKDFVPQINELTLDGKMIIAGVAFGVLDAITQNLQLNQAASLACMAAFFSGNLCYEDDAIPVVLKDLMIDSQKHGSKKYDSIILGGKAAHALSKDPDNLKPLSDFGFDVCDMLNAVSIW